MSIKSLEAFEAQLKNDKATSDAKRIIELLKKEPTTIDVLMFRLNIKYSTITARISDLHSIGYVNYIVIPTGGQSWLKYVDNEPEREAIRKQVAAELRSRWIKKGLSAGYLTEKFGIIELSNEIVLA